MADWFDLHMPDWFGLALAASRSFLPAAPGVTVAQDRYTRTPIIWEKNTDPREIHALGAYFRRPFSDAQSDENLGRTGISPDTPGYIKIYGKNPEETDPAILHHEIAHAATAPELLDKAKTYSDARKALPDWWDDQEFHRRGWTNEADPVLEGVAELTALPNLVSPDQASQIRHAFSPETQSKLNRLSPLPEVQQIQALRMKPLPIGITVTSRQVFAPNSAQEQKPPAPAAPENGPQQ